MRGPWEPAEWPEGLLGSVLPGPPQKDPLQSSLLTFRTAGQFGEHFIKSHSGGLAVMVATMWGTCYWTGPGPPASHRPPPGLCQHHFKVAVKVPILQWEH